MSGGRRSKEREASASCRSSVADNAQGVMIRICCGLGAPKDGERWKEKRELGRPTHSHTVVAPAFDEQSMCGVGVERGCV